MNEYTVLIIENKQWRIVVEAETPEQAAEKVGRSYEDMKPHSFDSQTATITGRPVSAQLP